MLDEEWAIFKRGWYEDEETHYFFRDFAPWRICVLPDQKEPDKFAWAVHNFSTRSGDHRTPFTSRIAAARNVFVQLLLWDGKVDADEAAEWLQEIQDHEPNMKPVTIQ